MEIVFYEKHNDYFKKNGITGFYGDVLDLYKLDIAIDGITYDDKWTVKRFLKGKFLSNNSRIDSIFKYLELNPEIIKVKLCDLSKTDFKFVLLAKTLLLNKNIIVFDYFDVGLAYKDQKRLIRIIRTLKKDGKTIVIVSKDLVFLSHIAESIIVYKDGEIIYNGNINDLTKLDIVIDENITKFIKLANSKNAKLDYTLDSKELLKDIYRSVY
ncbi:MAG: hypothetical protein J1F35_04400 [Erysipelotrichales bacterium]|nr:hypothetical protein [Erysipelotrichales bacterium]